MLSFVGCNEFGFKSTSSSSDEGFVLKLLSDNFRVDEVEIVGDDLGGVVFERDVKGTARGFGVVGFDDALFGVFGFGVIGNSGRGW